MDCFDKKPRVSVIIVTYNRPAMLQTALQSIFNQTFTDWEVIVNDYTEDWTINEQMHTKTTDSRVKWVRHKTNVDNIAYCWNEALRISTGEYWCILDDDNIKYADFLEKMVSFLDNNPEKDTVVCPMEYLPSGELFFKKPKDFEILKRYNHIDSNQVVHRRSLIDKIGYFDENFACLEDWDYFIRIYALNNFSGSAIGWVEDLKPLCAYMVHEKQRQKTINFELQCSTGTKIVEKHK